MTQVEKALNVIKKNMNQREYQVLIAPLLVAIEQENNFKIKQEVKNKVERVFNLLSNSVESKTMFLDSGVEVITKDNFLTELNNSKNIL